MIKHLLIFLLLGSLTNCANCQEDFSGKEIIMTKLNQYAKAHPDNVLYLHTDKTIYTNNETIWFSGYLLKTSPESLQEHSILSVALLREDNRDVFLQSKYLLSNGWS